jgi:hypothetical protein
MSGNNIRGRIIWGRNMRGRKIPAPISLPSLSFPFYTYTKTCIFRLLPTFSHPLLEPDLHRILCMCYFSYVCSLPDHLFVKEQYIKGTVSRDFPPLVFSSKDLTRFHCLYSEAVLYLVIHHDIFRRPNFLLPLTGQST